MIINKKSAILISLTLATLLILSLLISPAISFAAKENKAEVIETQETEAPKHAELNPLDTQEDAAKKEPSRSGSAPHLKSNVTTSYTAYGIVNEEFEFSDHWMEYYFEDPENDTLSFYASINDGVQSQSYFTVLTDEDDSDVTTFTYTPASAGTYDIKIYANDGTSTSTDYLNITLVVESSNSSNTCYVNINIASAVNDFTIKNSSGKTVRIGSGSISNNVKTYTMNLAKGTYTFEGTPVNGDQPSGMSFTVPTTSGAGTSSNPDVINIKEVDVTVSAASALHCDEYDFHLVNASGNDVTPGRSTATLSSSTVMPLLVLANGNAELYNYIVEPGTFNNSSNYAAYYEGNVTFTGTATTAKAITLPSAITCTFNVPTGATMQVFKQLRNYQTVEVSSAGNPTTSNGIDTYTYRLPQSSTDKTYTYRVSDIDHNKVTKAGYLDLSSAFNKSVSFDTSSPTEKSLNADGSSKYNSSTTLGSRAEDSVLLNVKKDSNTHFSHNFRSLAAGETFKLRAYRGAWQIINSDVGNIMIEPDFHFTVVKGADLITVDQDPNNDGHQSWCNVTANSGASGLAIVKVTYDAIDVDGMSYSNNTSQKFYATAEGREGYAIFNVGGTEIDGLMINAATSGTRDAGVDWDSEIDTFYYLGNSGTLKINPTAPDDTVTEVAYTHSATGSFTTVTKNGNYYEIPISGNFNLIRIKAGTKVEYVPIRASKIKILVDDQELTSSTTVAVNQNHTIKLSGIYIPVPKFSGIYNPMMNKVNYTVGNSTVSGNNLQYNFITQNKITWKPTSTGTYNFTNGYHSMRMFCNTTAKWGHHRLLTDTGVGANFSAGLVNGVFNIYPDFSITVS